MVSSRQATADIRRVAVVTGGSSGIGRACAAAFGADGFVVAILARRPEVLAAMANERMRAFPCDVADRAQVERTAEGVATELGRVDVLVNAAGIFPRALAEGASAELIAEVIGTNLVGTINCCTAFLPYVKSVHGSIVNISSRLAHQPTAGVALYAASKGGVESYSKALAVELGPISRVRVNVVRAGLAESEMLRRLPDADAIIADRKRQYPLGRLGQPADIAAVVSFLASDKSVWLTGAVIAVDGGASVYGGG